MSLDDALDRLDWPSGRSPSSRSTSRVTSLRSIAGARRALARTGAVILEYSPDLSRAGGLSAAGMVDAFVAAGFATFALDEQSRLTPIAVDTLRDLRRANGPRADARRASAPASAARSFRRSVERKKGGAIQAPVRQTGGCPCPGCATSRTAKRRRRISADRVGQAHRRARPARGLDHDAQQGRPRLGRMLEQGALRRSCCRTSSRKCAASRFRSRTSAAIARRCGPRSPRPRG